MGPVDICFPKVDTSSTAQVFSQAAQQPIKNARLYPLLEPPETRRRRWVPPRQIRPWRSGAKNPEHPVQNRARRCKRPPPSTSSAEPLVAWNEILDRFPLLVRQVHLNV